ncbi:hypothetical protein SLS60_002387 [Paraconiothyrium brasiliense]|uniref:Uncharacterized protein n=1 Tax=Paraconiothyrium brasiliense TaxID=300254 RepID=A0ABR3S259_9PLEO
MAKKLEPRLPYNSEEANWRWMFAELFPNKRIPSPYFGDEDWNKNDAYVDDAAADSGLERRLDLFQTALPARTLESFQRRIELLLQREEDFGHRQLLEATLRGEFKDLLQQSVLEAIGSLQESATQLQQQDSVSSDQIAVRSKGVLDSSRYNEGAGEDAGSSAEITLESDQLSNPKTEDGEFRLDDWVVNVDFDADAVIRDTNLSHGDFNEENFWTNLEGAYAEFDHTQSPALLDLGAVSSTHPARVGAESSLNDLNTQANCSGVDANITYKDSTLDPINVRDLNGSSKVDTGSNSALLQNVSRVGHKTLPALSTAEHDGQKSTREDNQRALAASRIVYEPDAGTWASGVTGNLFGGQYQNSVARFQIGQMQATQDLHGTDSNFGPLSEAEADAEID